MNAGRSLLVAFGLMSVCPLAQSQTQINPDGSLGTTVSTNGSVHTIDGGTTVGGENLFHSFSQFDLLNGDTANFAGTGLLNIISRISGGASTIDGRIQGPAGGTNLWIINPNGVVFETNSSLDVTGSFNISTADYLLLENGGQFFASPNLNSVLTVGDPTTFGFLASTTHCGSLANCAIDINNTTLEAAPGQALSFVGEEVRIGNSTLRALGGRINLASVGSAGHVTLLPDGIDNSGITYSGDEDVSMSGMSTIDVSGDGGSVYIRGGSFEFGTGTDDDETLLANVSGTETGGIISIDVVNEVVLHGEISTATSGSGDGADISISADSFRDGIRDSGIGGNTDIVTSTSGSGNSGSIFINARVLDLNTEFETSTSASGNAGDINISGNDLDLNVWTAVTGTSGSGRGGDINITATGEIRIQGGDFQANTSGTGAAGNITLIAQSISATSQNFSMSTGTFGGDVVPGEIPGNGGNITFFATEFIDLSTGNLRATSSSAGTAGTVRLEAPTVELSGNSSLNTASSGDGMGGRIELIGADILLSGDSFLGATASAAGPAGTIWIDAATSFRMQGGDISTSTSGIGDAGDIMIESAGLVDITGFSRIYSASNGLTAGSAGSISITGETVQIRDTSNETTSDDRATISVQTSSDETDNTRGSISIMATDQILITHDQCCKTVLSATTEGASNGGSITLDAPVISISDSRMEVATSGAGDGGDINISGSTSLTMTNTIVEAGTHTSGAGGDIFLNAGTLNLMDGTDLLANSLQRTGSPVIASGRAGNITIRADDANLHRVFIEAVTSGSGTGGDISIEGSNSLTIGAGGQGDSTILATTSSQSVSGVGGSITLSGGNVHVTGGSVISADTTGAADGGIATLNASNLLIDGDASISTSTTGSGNAGDIDINGTDVFLSETYIGATTSGTGAGGNISIDGSDSLTMGAGIRGLDTTILATTSSQSVSGVGGSITLSGGNVHVTDGSVISADTTGVARGGTATVNASNLLIDGGAIISTSTQGSGNAGDIDISANDVTLSQAYIEAATSGSGEGGNISIDGSGSLIIGADTQGLDSTILASTSSQSVDGIGGSITLSGGNVHVTDGASISVETTGVAAGGIAIVNASDFLIDSSASISSTTRGGAIGGDIVIDADTVTISTDENSNGGLLATTVSSGDAGTIQITAGSMVVENYGSVSGDTTSTDAVAGAGGTVDIVADSLLVHENGSITANTESTGIGGNVFIDANEMTVLGPGLVSVTTSNSGTGGNIDITGGLLTLTEGGSIIASTSADGLGGSIRITSDNLQLDPGSLISANAIGAGDAGAIDIDATETIFLDNANIQSTSELSNGGDVEVSAGDLIFFTDSTITTSANAMSGNAGDIRLGTDTNPAAPAFLIFQGALIEANAGASGGAINVHAQYILGSDYVFKAISDTGNDGEVIVDVPPTDMVSVISQTKLPILNIADLLDDQCVVSALSERSSFIVDTVGLPPSPEAYKSSGYYLPGNLPTTTQAPSRRSYVANVRSREGC